VQRRLALRANKEFNGLALDDRHPVKKVEEPSLRDVGQQNIVPIRASITYIYLTKKFYTIKWKETKIALLHFSIFVKRNPNLF
jgi:hypothetical protein